MPPPSSRWHPKRRKVEDANGATAWPPPALSGTIDVENWWAANQSREDRASSSRRASPSAPDMASAASIAPPQQPESRSTANGFAYLSAQTLAAAKAGASSAAPSAYPTVPPTARTTPRSPSLQSPTEPATILPSPVSTFTTPFAMGESSLARLRALAAASPLPPPPSPSLVVPTEPARHPAPLHNPFAQHTEPAQQQQPGSAPSSAPSTPYTPDLVRRLSALNGATSAQPVATFDKSRLRRYRAAAEAAAMTAYINNSNSDHKSSAAASSGGHNAHTIPTAATAATTTNTLRASSSDGDLSASLYRNEEDVSASPSPFSQHQPQQQRQQRQALEPPRQRVCADRPAQRPTAPAAQQQQHSPNFVDVDNEEELPSHGFGSSRDNCDAFATASRAAPDGVSVLDRLRAGGRTTPPTQAPPLAPAPLLSASPWTSVAHLHHLRQRASPMTTAGPLEKGNPVTSTSTAPSTTAADSAFASSPFMNLERMRVGHANTPASTAAPSAAESNATSGSKPICDAFPPSPTSERRNGHAPEAVKHVPPYQLLAQTHSRTFPGNHFSAQSAGYTAAPIPGTSPRVPIAVDDAGSSEDDEVRDLELHLSRYQTETAASAPNHLNENGQEAGSWKRPTRRSRRRPSSMNAKREAAIATLVKGSPSGSALKRLHANPLVLGAEKCGPTSSHAAHTATPSAQLVHRLRQLAAPVPVGEFPATLTSTPAAAASTAHTGKGSGGTAFQATPSSPSMIGGTAGSTSTLPPSWSAASPFAPLASPALYGMLHAAAHEHQNRKAAGNSERRDAGDADNSTAASPPTSSSLPFPPSNGQHSAHTASSSLTSAPQCFIFDTSSLLDSEPGVLNLLLERAHVGVPFTVLDELDHMHKLGGGGWPADANANRRERGYNNGSSGAHDREWRRKRAHDLRNWIASCLNRGETHLLLQKRSEVVDEYDRHIATNDDQILGYAVYLRRHREKVLFVTEDKFLRIKAASELGKAYSYAEVRRFVGMPAMTNPTSPRPFPRATGVSSGSNRTGSGNDNGGGGGRGWGRGRGRK